MFDPDNFWNHALQLLSQPGVDECSARVAAGRAYYAFFLTVRNRLQNQGVTFRKDARAHTEVTRELRRRHRTPMEEALKSLYRERENADYQLENEVTGSQVSYLMDASESPYLQAKTL